MLGSDLLLLDGREARAGALYRRDAGVTSRPAGVASRPAGVASRPSYGELEAITRGSLDKERGDNFVKLNLIVARLT